MNLITKFFLFFKKPLYGYDVGSATGDYSVKATVKKFNGKLYIIKVESIGSIKQ